MSNDSRPYVVHSVLGDKLDRLVKETEWLLGLARHLHDAADTANTVLQSIELTPPEPDRVVARRYLATASNRQLREDLIAARGDRGAAYFRTKLNLELEARRGRRHPINGMPRLNGGNGARAYA